jgi:ABC-type sugar transport system permease subunit
MRVILFTPSMLSLIVVGYVWSYIYAPLGGMLNEVLTLVGLKAWVRSWLGDPMTALPAIVIANIWMFAGHATATFLAGYLSIPRELFDSAQIDGASGWQRFKSLDWPLLAPAATINITFATIGSLRTFDLVFVMSPNNASTDVLSQQIYSNAFQNYQFGYGAAMAMVMFVATVVISVVLTYYLKRREARL